MAPMWGGGFDGHEIDEPTWVLYGVVYCRHCGTAIHGTLSFRECTPSGWKMEDQNWPHEEFSPMYIRERAESIRGGQSNGLPRVREDPTV